MFRFLTTSYSKNNQSRNKLHLHSSRHGTTTITQIKKQQQRQRMQFSSLQQGPNNISSNPAPITLKHKLDSISSELQQFKIHYDLIYPLRNKVTHPQIQSFMKCIPTPNTQKDNMNDTQWYWDFICPITYTKFRSPDACSKKIGKKLLCRDILQYWDSFFRQYYKLCHDIEESQLEQLFHYESIQVAEGDSSSLHACAFTCPISQKVYKSRGGYGHDTTPPATETTTKSTSSTSKLSYFTTSKAAKRNVCSQVLSSISDKTNTNALFDISVLQRVSYSTTLQQQMQRVVQCDFTCPIIPSQRLTTTIPAFSASDSFHGVAFRNKDVILQRLDRHWKDAFEAYYKTSDSASNQDVPHVSDGIENPDEFICPVSNKVYTTCDTNNENAVENGNDGKALELKRDVTLQILLDKREDLLLFYEEASSPTPQPQPQQAQAQAQPQAQPQPPNILEEIDKFYKPYTTNNKKFKDAVTISTHEKHPSNHSDQKAYSKGAYTCPLTHQTFHITKKSHPPDTNIQDQLLLDISSMVIQSWKNRLVRIYQRHAGMTDVMSYVTYESSERIDENTPTTWICSFTCPLPSRENKVVYRSIPYIKKNMALNSILPAILSDWNEDIFWNLDCGIILTDFYSELSQHTFSSLDSYIQIHTNSNIKLRGDVAPYLIDFICPLTGQTYSNTTTPSVSSLSTSESQLANGFSYPTTTSFYSKEEAMLNILLQVLSNWEEKIQTFIDIRSDDDCLEQPHNFDSMFTYEQLEGKNCWNGSFVCPLTKKEYLSRKQCNHKLLAKFDIMTQMIVDYKDDLSVKESLSSLVSKEVVMDTHLTHVNVKSNHPVSNVTSSTIQEEESDEDNDQDSSFVLQSIPTASPMDLILQAWNDNNHKHHSSSTPPLQKIKYNATMPPTLQKEHEAHSRANQMLLWMSNHDKLNSGDSDKLFLSSSSYIQILEALSQVHNLPYDISSSSASSSSKRKQHPTTIPNNDNIILDSLKKVQIMASKVVKKIQEQQDDTIIPTDVYNIYLKCLRNEKPLLLAQEADHIFRHDIQYPNRETYKILMQFWNDVPPLSQIKNLKIMETLILNEDHDTNGLKIDKEILILALQSLILDDSKGWDIDLAKWYIEQAKMQHDGVTPIIDVDVLNAPLKTRSTSTQKSNACLTRTAEQAEEWLTYMQTINNDNVGTNITPNSDIYSHIMKAWCKVANTSDHGLKRAEDMAQQLLQQQQLSNTIDPAVFYPLLQAYADTGMHDGALNRIEKWVDVIGMDAAGYYAIQAWCTHFQSCLVPSSDDNKRQQLSSHAPLSTDMLNCAHNCKDWMFKLYPQESSSSTASFDLSFISNILKIWGHEDVLKSLPQDGQEILIYLLHIVEQQLLQDKQLQLDNYEITFVVLEDLIASICRLDITEQHDSGIMKRNGFHLLFPQIERLLHQLDDNTSHPHHHSIQSTTPISSSISDTTSGSLNATTNKPQAIVGFYISLLNGCKILTTEPHLQGDAIRITMKILDKLFPPSTNNSNTTSNRHQSISQEDMKIIMTEVVSVSNNMKDYKEQFLEKVVDVILSSLNHNMKHQSSLIKSCLDVIADAKGKDDYYLDNNNNRKYNGSGRDVVGGRYRKRASSRNINNKS